MNVFIISITICLIIVSGIEGKSKQSDDKKVSKESIEKVREHVVKYASKNPKSIHEFDINRVKEKDWIIERYLQETDGNEVEAQKELIQSLKYIKKENFHDINDTYFPSEMWGSGASGYGGRGKNGEQVGSTLMRCHIPINLSSFGAEYKKLFLKFGQYFYHKLITSDDNGKYIVNNNLEHLSQDIFDLEYYTQLGKDMHNYRHGRFILLQVDLSKEAEKIAPVLFKLMNIKDYHMIKNEDLGKWVKLDTIEKRFYGKKKNNGIPDGVKSGKCLPHLKAISADVWTKVRKQNIKCIEENMKYSGIKDIDEYLRTKC